MKIHNVDQQSLEWLVLRSGIPTASEWDALITPKGEIRKGDGVKTYLATKLAEWWHGGPVQGAMTLDMEAGKIREETAIPWYEFMYETEITRVGFVTSDDGKYGCSPDGLLGKDSGIEVKCPAAATHIKYLLGQKLPDDYVAQVQGSMLVTGRDVWRFLSFRPGFPALVLNIQRDPEYIESLTQALQEFNERFEAGKKRLIELNGGKEPPKNSMREALERRAVPTNEPERVDIIP